jgi:hypothetical protein
VFINFESSTKYCCGYKDEKRFNCCSLREVSCITFAGMKI